MEEKLAKLRRRHHAIFRFIADTFKLKMLSETILHEIVSRLLKSKSDNDALEAAAIIFMCAGRDLEHQQSKV